MMWKWIFIVIGCIIVLVSTGFTWKLIGLGVVIIAGMFNSKTNTVRRIR